MNRYIAILIIGLLLIPAGFSFAQPPNEIKLKITEKDGLFIFDNDVFVVAIPTVNAFPMYFWWYKGQNDTVYMAKYIGLAEAWIPPAMPFRHGYMFKKGDFAKQILHRMMERGFGKEINVSELLENLMGTLNLVMKGKGNIEELVTKIDNLKKELAGVTNVDAETQEMINALIEKLDELKVILLEISEGGLTPQLLQQLIRLTREIKNIFMDFKIKMRDKIELCRSIIQNLKMASFHPFLLPFAALEWTLEDPKNITDNKGNVIGVQFSFVSTGARAPVFNYFERIEIRNRIYITTVTEEINGIEYTVSRAELKNDIIIKGWKWNMDTVKEVLGEHVEVLNEHFKPTLTLISHMTILPSLEEAVEEELSLQRINVTKGFKGMIKVGNRHISSHEEMENDFDKHLEILTEEGEVAGFYKFVPGAKVIYPNGTVEILDVKGVFWITNRHVIIFLVYPYFNGGTLEHDPSIGVSVPEITEEEPNYTIIISGGEIKEVETITEVVVEKEKEREITIPIEILTLIAIVILIIIAMVLRKR